MIFSIHVPKTAGTSFRHLLQKRFGTRLATYYGPRDANTDLRLEGVGRSGLVAALPALEAGGVEILHGHLRAEALRPTQLQPEQIWMWVRDPVERIISHYFFLAESDSNGKMATRIKASQIELLDFAAGRRAHNLQSKYLGDLPLERLGFLGLTERYADCVNLLWPQPAIAPTRTWNRTRQKPAVDEETRRRIAEINARDVELYRRAKALVEERLGSEFAGPPGSLGKLQTWLGRSAQPRAKSG